MEPIEFIEAFIDGRLSPEEKSEFETRIAADPSFAEEVGFYLSSRQAAAYEMKDKKERFKKLYEEYNTTGQINKRPVLIRKLLPWLAAAAIVCGIIIAGYLSFVKSSDSPQQLADVYIKNQLQTLGVTMSSTADSLQTGLRLYNEGRLGEALDQFERLVSSDTSSIEIKKYAGIVSLRMNQYDKAIHYFTLIENTPLYVNPGKFYHALTLMKRNRPGDKENAKSLLQQVVEDNLEGKNEAQEWLDKW